MTTGRIATDVQGGIARVILDNPGRKNALNLAMWEELRQICISLAHEPGVRAVVLSGRGADFSAGADLSEFPAARATPGQVASYSGICHAATDAILDLPVPVIAEVRGACLGAGAVIALCADLRYLAEDASFGIPAARLGLAFETHWLQRMVETLGVSRTAELLFTARSFAAEAGQAMGFAHAVLPPDRLGPHVAEVAHGIATLAPLTLRAAKAGLKAIARDDAAAGARAEALVVSCAGSRDYRRALDALARKKRPEFHGD